MCDQVLATMSSRCIEYNTNEEAYAAWEAAGGWDEEVVIPRVTHPRTIKLPIEIFGFHIIRVLKQSTTFCFEDDMLFERIISYIYVSKSCPLRFYHTRSVIL